MSGGTSRAVLFFAVGHRRRTTRATSTVIPPSFSPGLLGSPGPTVPTSRSVRSPSSTRCATCTGCPTGVTGGVCGGRGLRTTVSVTSSRASGLCPPRPRHRRRDHEDSLTGSQGRVTDPTGVGTAPIPTTGGSRTNRRPVVPLTRPP